jgi:hypothetical protein
VADADREQIARELLDANSFMTLATSQRASCCATDASAC